MRKTTRILSLLLAIVMMTFIITGCTQHNEGNEKVYSYDEAVTELNAFNQKIKTDTIDPVMDIYDDDSEKTALADISVFELTTEGSGDINLEIAAPSELSGAAPDNWLNIIADDFNKEKKTIDGKTVSVTVRKIASGEAVTYIADGNYKPDLYIPSSYAWGEMLTAKGVKTTTLAERTLGNTAGILMEKDTYDTFIDKYETLSLDKVIEASLAGDLTFAYTNPYTSATGLNALASTLTAFDAKDPLSDAATLIAAIG